MESITIDCDECVLQDTEACGGCVVSALCGPPGVSPVVIGAEEARVVRLLGDGGLVPPLRHRRRTVCA
jgi:hypothetical protein